MIKRAVFCRVGWMKNYNGITADDPKIIGGGSYNKTHDDGGERFNFRKVGGRHYGYWQPSNKSKKTNLRRIDPDSSENPLREVLVIFVAVDPDRGQQRVVGWYANATVFGRRQKSKNKRRDKTDYFAVAAVRDSVLLQVEPYKRKWPAKAGIGGIGQSNVCYLYYPNGQPKNFKWQKRIIRKFENYQP